MKRIIAEASVRYVTGLSVPQQQFALGTDLSTYELWTKKEALPKLIDELGGDARLLWIGPKRLERVVLFLHGKHWRTAKEFRFTFLRGLILTASFGNAHVVLAICAA